MGRKMEIDIDRMIARGRILTQEGPGLLKVAAAMFPQFGWAGKIAEFAPDLAGPLFSIVDKMANVESDDGGLGGSAAKTGYPGNGRLSYLNARKNYNDKQVVAAVEYVTSPGNSACERIIDTINSTLRIMFPVSDGNWDDTQNRAAIDQVLETNLLPTGMRDKFGDMTWFVLQNGTPPIEEPKTEVLT